MRTIDHRFFLFTQLNHQVRPSTLISCWHQFKTGPLSNNPICKVTIGDCRPSLISQGSLLTQGRSQTLRPSSNILILKAFLKPMTVLFKTFHNSLKELYQLYKAGIVNLYLVRQRRFLFKCKHNNSIKTKNIELVPV